MLLNELYDDDNQMLAEYGKHGFGGYGQGFFKRSHYEDIAGQLSREDDPVVKEALTEWFINAFNRDNHAFKTDVFTKWVEDGRLTSRNPTWQQRHFYYLAELIKTTSDRHMAEYMCDWLGQLFGSRNPSFQMKRWRKFCGIDD